MPLQLAGPYLCSRAAASSELRSWSAETPSSVRPSLGARAGMALHPLLVGLGKGELNLGHHGWILPAHDWAEEEKRRRHVVFARRRR